MLFAISLFIVSPARASNYYADQPKWEQSITGVRLFDILHHYAPISPATDTEPIAAASCLPPKKLEEFFRPKAQSKVPTPQSPVGISFLQKKGRQIKDVFRVLRSSVTGNAFLESFLPEFGYRFRITQMTDDVQNLFGARANLVIAAYSPERKTLFFNQASEVGRAAVALLHEITHSLDAESHHAVELIRERKQYFRDELLRVVSAAKRRTAKADSDLHLEDYKPQDLAHLSRIKTQIDEMESIRSYRTERLAYDASYVVWTELAKLYPEYYRPPIRRGVASTPFEPVNFTDDELVRTLRLNPYYIRKYLSGHCAPIGSTSK